MATSDPSYVAGDVVVVPFPYSDRFAEKRRPALVVSSPSVACNGYLWVVMITSARNSAMPHDLPILDLNRAGLSSQSIVRPIKIACVEPARIIRRAGNLERTLAESVFETIRLLIGASHLPNLTAR